MELGFLERVEDHSDLSSTFFPSKVGGKPAWLDLQYLPAPEVISCRACKAPLTFLLQVYAPLSDGDDDDTFHRTIFLFMCKDPICHQLKTSECFRVLRCQLPKDNNFYDNPPSIGVTVDSVTGILSKLELNNEDVKSPPPSDITSTPVNSMTTIKVEGVVEQSIDEVVKVKPSSTVPLCVVCGISGPKSCARCKQTNYCSKEHQIHDWKSGHKLFCSDLAQRKLCTIDYDPSSGVTLPLFEIVTEPEPDTVSLNIEPERSVEERMADYHKIAKTWNLSVSDVKKESTCTQEANKEKKSDKQFKAFKKRVALEPEQVIRYEHGGSPLFVSSEGVPSEGEIPVCSCGAKRVFELQVMPQLLYYLKLDEVRGPSIDWGTLLIYTCANSCSSSPIYKEEFLWRQHVSQ